MGRCIKKQTELIFLFLNCENEIVNYLQLPPDHNESSGVQRNVHEELFNELFRQHEHHLYTFLLKVTRSDAQSKDILQEVFLKLWMIRNQLNEIENIKAFLYRLTENKLIDFLRAAATQQKLKQQLWRNLQATETEQPDCIEENEYHEIIRRAVMQLPAQRRTIYLLSKHEGVKQKQIALALNISPNTVRNQLASAFLSILSYMRKNLSAFLF